MAVSRSGERDGAIMECTEGTLEQLFVSRELSHPTSTLMSDMDGHPTERTAPGPG